MKTEIKSDKELAKAYEELIALYENKEFPRSDMEYRAAIEQIPKIERAVNEYERRKR